jgi:hypothetical protein
MVTEWYKYVVQLGWYRTDNKLSEFELAIPRLSSTLPATYNARTMKPPTLLPGPLLSLRTQL